MEKHKQTSDTPIAFSEYELMVLEPCFTMDLQISYNDFDLFMNNAVPLASPISSTPTLSYQQISAGEPRKSQSL